MDRKLFIEGQPVLIKSTLWRRFLQNVNYLLCIYTFKGSNRLRRLFDKLLILKVEGPVLISTKYGFDIICMDPITDKGVERPLFLNGTYEAGTLDIIGKCLRKGDTFIDVGANIGLMSIFASKIVGSNGIVYAFEPEPETFVILRKNIEINKINNI